MPILLGRRLINRGAMLAISFGLAACGEETGEIYRKRILVNLLMDRSLAACALQRDNVDQKPYADRLRDVLHGATSSALSFFRSADITICLDKRLDHQSNGFNARGAYYPSQRILTLWDNGKAESRRGIFESSAVTYGYLSLNTFADSFRERSSDSNVISEVNARLIGYSYLVRFGKSQRTQYAWQDVPNFWTNNPRLAAPPTIGTPQ